MRREQLVQARCSPLEKRAAKAIADAEGLGIGETLRLLIRAEAKRRGLWVPRDTDPSIPD